MDLQAGQFVTPNIRLVELVGQGGMGSVWIARHETLDTDVAVKFISHELAEKEPSLLSRFKREASLAAKIRSLHVVQMFDHGFMKDGTPYIVMELLEGESLGARLDRCGRISLEQTGVLLSQVTKALDRAHGLSIIHRDLKPDNLFLIDSEYDLFVKVLDFGIAKSISAESGTIITGSGEVAGTPLYMSPEQLLDTKNVDHRTDLWSLAVIVYVCVTGRPPFVGETLTELSIAIFSAPHLVASSLLPGLPPAIDQWFDRALNKEKDGRFQTASELAAAFAEALGHGPAFVTDGSGPIAAVSADSDASLRGVEKQPTPQAGAAAPPTLASWSGYERPDILPHTPTEASSADRQPALDSGRKTLVSGSLAIGNDPTTSGTLESSKTVAATSRGQLGRPNRGIIGGIACFVVLAGAALVWWQFGTENKPETSVEGTTASATGQRDIIVADRPSPSSSSSSAGPDVGAVTKTELDTTTSVTADKPTARPTSTPSWTGSSSQPRAHRPAGPPSVRATPSRPPVTTCPALKRDEQGDWVANPDCL